MIETPGLTFRRWRPDDAAAHHAICNDPRVAARLGMWRRAGSDLDDPDMAVDDPQRMHILCRIDRPAA